jgi:hypothetical protein
MIWTRSSNPTGQARGLKAHDRRYWLPPRLWRRLRQCGRLRAVSGRWRRARDTATRPRGRSRNA